MKAVKTQRWRQDQSGAAGAQIAQVRGNVHIHQYAAPDGPEHLRIKGHGNVGVMGDYNTVNINISLPESLCALLEQIAGRMQRQRTQG